VSPSPSSAEFSAIRYETSGDHVATITLNRPEVLNAFDRQMCEEVRMAWRLVKDDPDVHAAVVRAEGERAFCAGLDTKKPYGQPDDVWNHEDPGELLSPKWQKLWKPVVCAVQGMCTAGAFYLLNEADIVICSPEATFFDSHVSFGMVSALEPVGLMRRIGLAETLRMALLGNDERVTAETALRTVLTRSPPASPPGREQRRRERSRRYGSRWTVPTGPPWNRDSSTPGSAILSA
jgi:enoyl-CoA hydratase/carnithine racemase